MLHIQKFQNNRQDFLRHYQQRRSVAGRNFSLCSDQYSEKFPKASPSATPYDEYSRNQTLFFLSRMPSLEIKSKNENQQQTGITRDNKDSMTTLLKYTKRDENSEKLSTPWYDHASNNAYRLTQRNLLSTCQTPTEPYRSQTAPLILNESVRRTISARIKSNTPSRPTTALRTPHLFDSSDNFDTTLVQFQPSIVKCDNHSEHQPEIDTSTHLDLSVDINPSNETTINDQDEPKILHRDGQNKMNGFQHIANLGNWQRSLRNSKIELPKKLEYEEEHPKDNDSKSSKLIYEYKSPFSQEYDHAISIQGQFPTNNNMNEWDLKDFYRDVKTDFEPETNTKPVFEKCLKLARLQANTIKWEQRRRQNLNNYNRLIKTTTLDNNLLNFNGNFSVRNNNNEKDYRDINELKRELRCNECKRVACLGNCAPGQEYHQYKRLIPFSSLPTTREQVRCKLNLRTQRSTNDLRPRSTQQIVRETKYKFEQTNLNPVIVVPLFQDESQTKRPQKKLMNNYLHGKSIRSQRKEALTLISTHKILS